MDDKTLVQALQSLVLRDSLQCLGCKYEDRCGTHGCAIIKRSVERLEQLTALESNVPLTLEELRGWTESPYMYSRGMGRKGGPSFALCLARSIFTAHLHFSVNSIPIVSTWEVTILPRTLGCMRWDGGPTAASRRRRWNEAANMF